MCWLGIGWLSWLSDSRDCDDSGGLAILALHLDALALLLAVVVRYVVVQGAVVGEFLVVLYTYQPRMLKAADEAKHTYVARGKTHAAVAIGIPDTAEKALADVENDLSAGLYNIIDRLIVV